MTRLVGQPHEAIAGSDYCGEAINKQADDSGGRKLSAVSFSLVDSVRKFVLFCSSSLQDLKRLRL